jgi:hypothetical protein
MARETIRIEAEMDEAHVATFLSALNKMQTLAESGESELVSVFVGDFAPHFRWTTPFKVELEDVKRGSIGYVYDPD